MSEPARPQEVSDVAVNDAEMPTLHRRESTATGYAEDWQTQDVPGGVVIRVVVQQFNQIAVALVFVPSAKVKPDAGGGRVTLEAAK